MNIPDINTILSRNDIYNQICEFLRDFEKNKNDLIIICSDGLHGKVSNEEILNHFGKHQNIHYCKDPYEAIDGADAMILLTEWKMFRNVSFTKLKERLVEPVIFDGRNQYCPNDLSKEGIKYIGIGRTNIKSSKLVSDKTI